MAELKLRTVAVTFLSSPNREGRAEGSNAAWLCACGESTPLLGRCFPRQHPRETVCPSCGRRYMVRSDADKTVAVSVEEVASPTGSNE